MKRHSIWLAFVVSAAMALAGYRSGSTATAAAASEKHWSYETAGDAVGPEGWGTLAGNATCSIGKSQSPVALVFSQATPTPGKLGFRYLATPLKVVNNGHTVQVNVGPGSSVEVGGTSYALAQFHFHSPSEHTLDGKSFPMEMHLVHLGADGKPALVVGVFIEEGAPSAALGSFFANLPKTKGANSEPAGVSVDPGAILPVSRAFLNYAGSLTVPPCSEGIRWYVLTTPVSASAAQIAAYRAAGLDHTNRPTQPFNTRPLFKSTTP